MIPKNERILSEGGFSSRTPTQAGVLLTSLNFGRPSPLSYGVHSRKKMHQAKVEGPDIT